MRKTIKSLEGKLETVLQLRDAEDKVMKGRVADLEKKLADKTAEASAFQTKMYDAQRDRDWHRQMNDKLVEAVGHVASPPKVQYSLSHEERGRLVADAADQACRYMGYRR